MRRSGRVASFRARGAALRRAILLLIDILADKFESLGADAMHGEAEVREGGEDGEGTERGEQWEQHGVDVDPMAVAGAGVA